MSKKNNFDRKNQQSAKLRWQRIYKNLEKVLPSEHLLVVNGDVTHSESWWISDAFANGQNRVKPYISIKQISVIFVNGRFLLTFREFNAQSRRN